MFNSYSIIDNVTCSIFLPSFGPVSSVSFGKYSRLNPMINYRLFAGCLNTRINAGFNIKPNLLHYDGYLNWCPGTHTPTQKIKIMQTNNDQWPNGKKLHPKMMASFFSRLNYIWYSSLTYIGFKREIIIDDVWAVMEHDSSDYNNKLFMNKFEQLKMTDDRCQPMNSGTKPDRNTLSKFNVNIIKIIFQTLRRYFLVGSFFKIFNDILIFVNPILMK